MTAAGHADFFRTQWAARLVDTCWIKRPTGATHNVTTGVNEQTFDDVYGTTGTPAACLVRHKTGSAVDAGQQLTEVYDYTVYVPYTVTTVEPGDLIDVTTTRDGHLNGATVTVKEVFGDTYNHVRALGCEEQTNG